MSSPVIQKRLLRVASKPRDSSLLPIGTVHI